jgi:hypothetical protein
MYGHGPDSAWPEDKPITGQVYFEANVTFDLDEEFPDSFSVSKGRLYTVINKLYRLSDYKRNMMMKLKKTNVNP